VAARRCAIAEHSAITAEQRAHRPTAGARGDRGGGGRRRRAAPSSPLTGPAQLPRPLSLFRFRTEIIIRRASAARPIRPAPAADFFLAGSAVPATHGRQAIAPRARRSMATAPGANERLYSSGADSRSQILHRALSVRAAPAGLVRARPFLFSKIRSSATNGGRANNAPAAPVSYWVESADRRRSTAPKPTPFPILAGNLRAREARPRGELAEQGAERPPRINGDRQWQAM
jgi:hypothetical protein